MPNGTQYDLSTAVQDPDFMRASIPDKISFLSAHDSDFANANLKDKIGYLNHILGQDQAPSETGTYQKLTASYNPKVEQWAQKHPVAGPILRFLDATGGAAISTPEAIVNGIKDAASSLWTGQESQTAQAVKESAKEWATNPNVRKAALSLLPEALGQGVGNVAGGEALGAVAKPIKQGAGVARESIGKAIHTPEGDLTPNAELAGKVGGGLAGTAVASPIGHPYIGAAAGYKLGPQILDKLFPEPEAIADKRALADMYQSKAEDLMRRGREQDALDRKQASQLYQQAKQDFLAKKQAATESDAQDLITRTKALVKPGEAPTAADLKRAGDLTQAPLARLKTLAKFGDKLAQNEINRRLRNQ